MAFPSSEAQYLSLSGLFLQWDAVTVGTPDNSPRTVFSNGVMQARVWLGWQYNPPSQTKYSIGEIESWLVDNVKFGVKNFSSHKSSGSDLPSGWTISSSGNGYSYDINDPVPDYQGKDVSHLVPDGNTNGSRVSFYITPPKEDASSLDIFAYFSYTDNTGQPWTVTTEPFTPFKIQPEVCEYTVNDFILQWPTKNDNYEIVAVAYNSQYPSTHYVKRWTGAPHALTVKPSVDSSTDISEKLNKPFDLNIEQTCYFVYLNERNKTAISLVDRDIVDQEWGNPLWGYLKYQNVSFVDAGNEWADVAKVYSFEKVSISSLLSGGALLMWQGNNNQHVDLVNDDNGDYYHGHISYSSCTIKATDSFGQDLDITIDFGDDADGFPDSWKITSISFL
ncbi:hypothetical protein ACIUZJ_23755 [Pseudomonas aeruginosa]|nr:hypothetical protein [Pseudomonas aeruginosa]